MTRLPLLMAPSFRPEPDAATLRNTLAEVLPRQNMILLDALDLIERGQAHTFPRQYTRDEINTARAAVLFPTDGINAYHLLKAHLEMARREFLMRGHESGEGCWPTPLLIAKAEGAATAYLAAATVLDYVTTRTTAMLPDEIAVERTGYYQRMAAVADQLDRLAKGDDVRWRAKGLRWGAHLIRLALGFPKDTKEAERAHGQVILSPGKPGAD